MSLIQYVRVAGTGQKVPAEIMPCSFHDMVNWQRLVHDPFIAPLGGIGHDWDWPALYLGCNAYEVSVGREVVTFQIRVEGPGGRAVPVAQCMLSMPYAFPKPGSLQKCVFVWFAVATPLGALQAFGVHKRFAMLAPMLDTAIMLSFEKGLAGRIGLHAAVGPSPLQSEALAQRYLAQGMSRRPVGRGWFRLFARREDGRLFYFDTPEAVPYAVAQDDLR